jgi:FMN-dependent NADH-azoreductase
MEHQESYLQTVLGFFGVTDVRFVRAEGMALGEEAKAQALAAASQAIEAHVQAGAANQERISQAA